MYNFAVEIFAAISMLRELTYAGFAVLPGWEE